MQSCAGFGDYIGTSNVRDSGASIQSKIADGWSGKIDYHFFQMSNASGAWYGLGNSLRGMGSGDDATLGHEIDLNLKWKPVKM